MTLVSGEQPPEKTLVSTAQFSVGRNKGHGIEFTDGDQQIPVSFAHI